MTTALFLLLPGLLCIAVALQVRRWRRHPQGLLSLPAALIGRLTTWQAALAGEQTPEAMRASRDKAIGLFVAPAIPLHDVRDLSIDGSTGPLALRLYRPTADEQLPVILFFHGGGWVLGNLESHDNLCRALAAKCRALVIAVDYRLAPEARFPAALEDATSALHWLQRNMTALGGDPARLVLAGDSAGGNLAAALALQARDQADLPIAAQLLFYPAVDLSRLDRPSTLQFAEGLFLTRERMAWFIEQYAPEPATRLDPLASPLLAPDHRRLPPALVITAQFDPLRDEGEAYAEALRQAGVDVQLQRYAGVLHGFASMDRWFPEAGQATDLAAAFLHQRFAARALSAARGH